MQVIFKIKIDIYNVNIPSLRDVKNSESVKKYGKEFQKYPFIKKEWLTDLFSLIMILVFGLFFHYFFGWSIFNVWNDVVILK
jgi:hypothetical protein